MMMAPKGVRHNPNSVGHPAGEELLKHMGTLITENIRDVDLGARYKKKQFAIVPADTDGNGQNLKLLQSLIGLWMLDLAVIGI